MSLKSSFAELAGRSSYWFLHTFMHGGSSLPGKITLKLDPDILQSFAKKYDLVIVTVLFFFFYYPFFSLSFFFFF